MMLNNNKDNKIEGILNALDHVERATVKPFFYSRVEMRLKDMNTTLWEKFSSLIAKPRVAYSGVFIILIINLFAIYSHTPIFHLSDQTDVNPAEEYSLVTNSFYDVENIKP